MDEVMLETRKYLKILVKRRMKKADDRFWWRQMGNFTIPPSLPTLSSEKASISD